LIKEFYNAVAIALSKSLPQKETKSGNKIKDWFTQGRDTQDPLKKNYEYISGKLKPFANLAEFIGLGETVKSFSDLLSQVSLEELKDRLNIFLKKVDRRLTIIIDDIDRLDKEEVHSIFRLVKLNADFQNTIYILSFDEEMVSKMVGQKYGDSQESGLFFLEKIIQVPLYLPKANSNDLRIFGLTLVSDVLNNINMMPSEDQQREFAEAFNSGLLLRMTSPRIATRYANILNFSLPILKGQVNIVDLMLIEGVRVFYPKYYDLVMNHPDLFLDGYRNPYGNGEYRTDKSELLKAKLETTSSGLQLAEKNAIQELLVKLFPRIKEALSNYSFNPDNYNFWYLQKRICSSSYFNRYFSFSILRGELSDRDFEDYLNTLETLEEKDGFLQFEKLTNGVDGQNLMQNLRMIENTVKWIPGTRICKYLCMRSNLFSNDKQFTTLFTSPSSQAAIFIIQFINYNRSNPEKFSFIEQLILSSQSIDFALELFQWLIRPLKNGEQESHIFQNPEEVVIFKTLKDRVLKECGNKPMFEVHPELSYHIFYFWSRLIDKNEVKDYLNNILNASPSQAIDLLRTFTPTYIASGSPNPIKGDLTEEYYQTLKDIYSIDDLMKHLTTCFTNEDFEGDAVFTSRFGNNPSDRSLILQLKHWYDADVNKAL
jgi:hypothetical protein